MFVCTPTTVVPQSSDSERNISPVITCTSQDGVELPELEQNTVTPTHVTPLFSAFEILTSTKTCQVEGGTVLEFDRKGTPTTVPPQATAYLGYVVAVNGDAALSCPSPPTFVTGDFGRP
jgi:hypothetical protein